MATETSLVFNCYRCNEGLTQQFIEVGIYEMIDGLPQWVRTIKRLCLKCAQAKPILIGSIE